MPPSRPWAQALACVLPLAAVLVSLPRESRATDFRLRWSAPAGCPQGAAVEAAITRLLRTGSPGERRPLDAVGTIAAAEPGYRLTLQLSRDGATSTREVRGATCTALADTAALVVALAVDPALTPPAPTPVAPATPATSTPVSPSTPATSTPVSPSTPATSTPVAPSTPPKPTPVAPTPVAPTPVAPTPPKPTPATQPRPPARPSEPGFLATTPTHSQSPRWRLSPTVLADIGTLHAPAAALELSAGVVLGPARIDAGFAYWLPQHAESDTDPTAGGDLGLEAGSLGVCALLPPLAQAAGPRFEIALPCAAFELGRMHADGTGTDNDGAGAHLWAAVRGGGAAAWAIQPWLRLRLRLEAAVPLVRPRFVVKNLDGPIHQSGPVAGRASLGLDLAF